MSRKKKKRQPLVAEYRADYRGEGSSPIMDTASPPEEGGLSFSADYREEGEKASLSQAPMREEDHRDTTIPPVEEEAVQEEEAFSGPEEETDLATGGEILAEEDTPEEDDAFSKEGAQQLGDFVREQRSLHRRGRHRYGVAVGSVVLLLALVGVVFLAVTAGQAIYRTANDDSDLRAYDKWLGPVVMQDPAAFDSIAQADPNMVMTASLWAAILNASADTFTSYDDQGRTLVPLGEVDAACKTLFGPDYTLQARTPEKETFFTFDSETNQFHVAPFSTQSSYQPYTESIRGAGDAVILRVGYVSPADDSYGNAAADAKPTPVKYMEYVLKENAATGEKYITAIHIAK